LDTLIEGFVFGIQQSTWLEGIAVLFGLLSVWYARKQNILVYPTGIVNVLIFVYICFKAKLYADMGINAYYFIMSLYGWYFWTRRHPDFKVPPITRNTWNDWLWSGILLITSFLALFFTLKNYTDSDVPFWDSLTTSFAFLAMWLMARKKLANWSAWIITNLLSIPLYFYKGLLLTSFQYLIFLILAIMGFITWRKEFNQREHA
jgi:nicotinamide mononucleotide transporter